MSKKELLEKRKELKAKKKEFKKHNSVKKKKLDSSWRRPRGLHNKLRLNKRGYGTKPSTGWGSPKEVRGLHPSGYEPVRVHNVEDLEDVEKELQGIIISSKVGNRKRADIIKEAQEKDITILNLNGKEYLKKIEENLEARKKSKEEKEKEKKSEEKDDKDSSGSKASSDKQKSEEKDEELTAEEKKKKEKKELDKTLTKSK